MTITRPLRMSIDSILVDLIDFMCLKKVRIKRLEGFERYKKSVAIGNA
jgi:hypothetical protein